MQTLQQLQNIIARLWHYGNARLQLVAGLILSWFILLVLFAIAPAPWLTLFLAVLPLGTGLWLLWHYPLVSAAVAAIGFRWLAGILAVQLVIGLYFSLVPVANDRGLVLVVIMAATAYFLFAVAGRVSVRPERIMSILFLIVIGTTIIFFLGGRAAIKQQLAATAPPVSQPAMEEFRCQAGEEVLTVLVGPGTFHRLHANQPWVAVVRSAGAEYPMPAGFSSWQGGAPEGLLRVRCLHDGTILRFQKVR